MERDNQKKGSPVWECFTKKDGFLATCKACHNDFSYKGTVSNLRKHWLNKHGNLEKMRNRIETSDSEHETGKKTNPIWSCFTKKDRSIASCNACNKEYNYRTNIANLKTHWLTKHVQDECSYGSDSESEEISTEKPSPTWKFFDVLDSDKFIANCKVCDREVPYDSMSDLTNHIREHDVITKDSDDEVFDSRGYKKGTAAWQFFKCVDKRAKIAMCLICHKKISFLSTFTSLQRHINNNHADYKLDDEDEEENTKTVMISSDGQLYEVDTSKRRNGETDDEKDPIEMDTIYLDDLKSQTNEKISPKIFKTKPHLYNLKSLPVKRQKIEKKQITKRLRKNRISSYKSSISSDEEIISRESKKEDSLNYFGKYVISLLKDLPKQVSEQLQGEIIKQIITTKVALQATAEFSETNSEFNQNTVNNQVTVTISSTDTEANVVNTDGDKNETNVE